MKQEPSTALALREDPAPSGMPAVVDKKALKSYLALIGDDEALDLQRQLSAAYDRACKALIGENDVQKEGSREFKKKSAWRKLGRYFSISTSVISRDERFMLNESTGESVFVATSTVRASAPWGQYSEAIAGCATDEETGRRKITIADAIATAETRATNRAVSNLIAMGEVSAEELSKNGRESVVEATVEEMTLAEAKAVLFPWRQPEKLRDKPLGDISTKTLETVRDTVKQDIEKNGKSPRKLELAKAVELILADRVANPSDDKTDGGESAGGAAVPAEPTPTCPVCAGAMSDDRLSKTNPKAPDFKCKGEVKAGCEGLYWPGQWPPKPAATDEQRATIKALLERGGDKIPKRTRTSVEKKLTEPDFKEHRAAEIIAGLEKTLGAAAEPAAVGAKPVSTDYDPDLGF